MIIISIKNIINIAYKIEIKIIYSFNFLYIFFIVGSIIRHISRFILSLIIGSCNLVKSLSIICEYIFSINNNMIYIFLLFLFSVSLVVLLYTYTTNKHSNRPYKKYNQRQKLYKSHEIDWLQNKKINLLKKKLKSKLDNITNKCTIILYYHDNCGHCIDFKPLWNKIKHQYSNHINFIEENCTNKSPNLDYVTGYPTIIINSKVYDGNRYELENYIKNIILD